MGGVVLFWIFLSRFLPSLIVDSQIPLSAFAFRLLRAVVLVEVQAE